MPHPISAKIAALRDEIMRWRWITAACMVALVVLSVGIGLGLVDYVLRPHESAYRWLAFGAFAAAAAWAAWRYLGLVRRRPTSELEVARRLERQFPDLHDSLASSYEFLAQEEDDPTAGSAMLRRAVVAQTTVALDELPLEEVVDRQPLKQAAKWLAVAAGVFLLALVIDARAVGTATARLLAPWSGIEWPRRHYLAFRDPPVQLAAGEAFEVELIDEAGALPDDVRITYRFRQDGRTRTESEPMQAMGDVMVARREGLRASFEFRAAGGDDNTMAWHRVEVVDPPRVASQRLTAHPPAYTGLVPQTFDRHARVLAGSHLELTGTSSEPLTVARVNLEEGEPIAGEVLPSGANALASAAGDSSENESESRRAFRIPPEAWVAAESTTYWVELESDRHATGRGERGNLQVDADPPPSVSWIEPMRDLYVLPRGQLIVRAAVKDNLAIQSADLAYTRRAAGAAPDAQPEPTSVRLYRGPAQIPPGSISDPAAAGDARVVEHVLDLEALALAPGDELALQVHATDYRPGRGEPLTPRFLRVVTESEFLQRLALRRQQIIIELERALALQRSAREQVRGAKIRLGERAVPTQADRALLQSAEVNQREVGRTLVDPAVGVLAEVAAWLQELADSQIGGPEFAQPLEGLRRTLGELADGPLPEAERALTGAGRASQVFATRAAEREPPANDPSQLDEQGRTARARLEGGVDEAAESQDEVIARLERALDDLARWAGIGRFARELAQLRDDQLALRITTETHLLDAAAADAPDASRRQSQREEIAASQSELGRRFDRWQQGLQDAVAELTADDPTAAVPLEDALEHSRELGTAALIRQTADELGGNRIGRGLTFQQQVAEQLQSILDRLRNRQEQDLGDLLADLQAAARELAERREELAGLREQLEAAEQQPPGDPEAVAEQEELAEAAQQLQEQLEQLTRQLARLTAEAASRSTAAASQRMGTSASQPNGGQPNAGAPNAGQPSSAPPSGGQARAAEEDLAQAAEELEQRIAEAEQQLAAQQLQRLQTEVQSLLTDQRAILGETQQADQRRTAAGTLSFAESRSVVQLSDRESSLAGQTRDVNEDLEGLSVFRSVLDAAAADMEQAGQILEALETGTPAQVPQENAVRRLQQILLSMYQPPPENDDDDEDTPPPPPPGDAPPPEEGEVPPDLQLRLAQIKLLRVLQADLNEETRILEAQQSRLADTGNQRLLDALTAQAERIKAEQGRLARLVAEMIISDNADDGEDVGGRAVAEAVDDAIEGDDGAMSPDDELRGLLDRLEEQMPAEGE